MIIRTTMILLLTVCSTAMLSGQTQITRAGQQPLVRPAAPATATFSAFRQQEEDDKPTSNEQVLAKQLDEFHKRLKELEEIASGLQDDQEDGSFKERIETIEDSLTENTDAIGDIDATFDNYVKSGHGATRMKLSGRVHLDYWNFPSEGADIAALEGGDPQDRVVFRRIRFGVAGKIDYNTVYKIEIEFAGGVDPSYRDVYLGFEHLPVFQTVLIGNQKRPYGLDHLNSSRYNVFIERPFVVEGFNEDSRRLGIVSYGVSEDLRHNWRYGLYHQGLTQTTDGFTSDNYQAEVAARWATTWWWDECSDGRGYGHFAIAGSYGSPNGLAADPDDNAAQFRTRPEARTDNRFLDTGEILGANTTTLGAIEGVLNVGPLQIVGEYQNLRVDRLAAFGPQLNFQGGYIQAAYFLTGEHMPWDRRRGVQGRPVPFENFFSVCDCDGFIQNGLGAWQVAARYSVADFSDEDIDGGRGESLTLALNWYWNAYARMQFNYLVGDIESASTIAGDYQILGARFMVDF